MSRQNPNIYDVAEAAGVSHQTVSRVINNHPSLRPETRKRVEAAMAELGYVPNRAARALVTKKSKLIGILASDTTLYGPAGMLNAIETEARLAGYVTMTVAVDPQNEAEVRAGVAHLQYMAVEGLILITAEHLPTDLARDGLPDIPIVALDSDYRADALTVNTNGYLATALATRHLIDLGHQQIQYITGDISWSAGRRRRDGYADTMTSAGLQSHITEGDWAIETGYRIGLEFDFPGNGVTGVVCANDHLALGLLKACRERAIAVPHDLSVVGFDDIPEAAYFAPPLTTVRQDFAAMGNQAIRVLLGALGQAETVENTELNLGLVVRDSTASPPRL